MILPAFHEAWVLLGLLLLPLVLLLARPPIRELPSDRIVLWARALAKLRSRKKAPRPGLLLLLDLCALGGFLLAGADPYLPEREGFRECWAVVDLSPSMAAPADPHRPSLGSRLERARAEVVALSGRLPPGIRLRTFGLEGERLPERAPETMRPGEEIARPGILAEFSGMAGRSACILFWSDGAGPSPWPKRRSNLFLRQAGEPGPGPAPQGGILEAGIEDPWPEDHLELEVLVRDPPGATALLLESPGIGKLEIAPLERAAEAGGARLRFRLPRGRSIRITRLPPDAFPLDDRLRIRARPAWHPEIGVFPADSPGAGVLGRFLASSLGGRLTTDGSSPPGSRIQIIEGGRLPAWPRDGVLRFCFGTVLPGMRDGTPLETFPDWRRELPVLRGLDLGGLEGEERKVPGPLPEGTVVLARVLDEPLLLWNPSMRLFWSGLPFAASNLERLPFLPVLCLRFCGEAASAKEGGGDVPTSVAGLLPPEEGELAVRPAGPPRSPRWFEPERPLWRFPLALALLALFLRILLPIAGRPLADPRTAGYEGADGSPDS